MRQFIQEAMSVPSTGGTSVPNALRNLIHYSTTNTARRIRFAEKVLELTPELIESTAKLIGERDSALDVTDTNPYGSFVVRMSDMLVLNMSFDFVLIPSVSGYGHDVIRAFTEFNPTTRAAAITAIKRAGKEVLGIDDMLVTVDPTTKMITMNNYFITNPAEYYTMGCNDILCKNVTGVGDELTVDNCIQMFIELIDDVLPYAKILDIAYDIFSETNQCLPNDDACMYWIDPSRYDIDFELPEVIEI